MNEKIHLLCKKIEYGKETINITNNRSNVHYGIYGMRPWNFCDI